MERQDIIEYILHEATVLSVNKANHTVTLALSDSHDCDGCPASRLCAAASSPDKFIVETADACSFALGDKVTLQGSERLHRKAIMLATVLPCIALVAVMVAVYILSGGNQLYAALAGIASMIFFFFILYICRNKIAHEFRFSIRKTND
ncbi:MAG: SoxR reducing system RseC family protein [Muribaculaceae bacterium]|nr:SoxR reducing system RseC family protein [Muribaculaceae bacterium]